MLQSQACVIAVILDCVIAAHHFVHSRDSGPASLAGFSHLFVGSVHLQIMGYLLLNGKYEINRFEVMTVLRPAVRLRLI